MPTKNTAGARHVEGTSMTAFTSASPVAENGTIGDLATATDEQVRTARPAAIGFTPLAATTRPSTSTWSRPSAKSIVRPSSSDHATPPPIRPWSVGAPDGIPAMRASRTLGPPAVVDATEPSASAPSAARLRTRRSVRDIVTSSRTAGGCLHAWTPRAADGRGTSARPPVVSGLRRCLRRPREPLGLRHDRGEAPPERGLRHTLHVEGFGVQEPEESGHPASHRLDEVVVTRQCLILQPEAKDAQRPLRAIQLRIEAGHDRVAPQDGQDVVPVFALGRGRVDLPAVVEPEQLLRPTTGRVERREEDRLL